jgi:hypothetical protein
MIARPVRPAVATVLAAVALVVFAPTGFAAEGTVSVRVVASTDDAEQSASSGRSYTNSRTLEFVVDAGTTQLVGMRFRNVAIPNGASITSAVIQFTASSTATSGTTQLTFAGEAVDNSAAFSTARNTVASRPRTTATVAWTPAAWTAYASGAAQRTPELAPLIQEIVNRPGWASGNALGIIASGTGLRRA